MRMVRFSWVRFVVAGMLVLAGATPARAQGQGNALLTGTVLDSDGVVPGASVTADAATSIARAAGSNHQGHCRLLALPPTAGPLHRQLLLPAPKSFVLGSRAMFEHLRKFETGGSRLNPVA